MAIKVSFRFRFGFGVYVKQPLEPKQFYTGMHTEIFGLWLIPAALELQYCGSRAATTCGSRAALKYFVMQISFPALSCGIVVASRRGLIGCR